MMERIAEASPRFKARTAGFLYLLIIVGALFVPFAVAPSGMMRGDAALPTSAADTGLMRYATLVPHEASALGTDPLQGGGDAGVM